MTRSLLGSALFLLVASTADAQQRRSAAGGSPPAEPREYVAPMARYPYAGSWSGEMTFGTVAIPVAVNIAVMNEKYTSVSWGPAGGKIDHLKTELSDNALRWEIAKNGGGVWVYEAARIAGDTITGTVRLKDYDGRDGQAETGKLVLVRQRR